MRLVQARDSRGMHVQVDTQQVSPLSVHACNISTPVQYQTSSIIRAQAGFLACILNRAVPRAATRETSKV